MKGTSNSNYIEIALLVLPLLLGIIIVAINNDGVNGFTEKIEAWIRKKKNIVASKESRFYRFALNPFLWSILKFCDWTDSFSHRGLKNGVRVTITLYLISVWLFLLYVAFLVVAVIAILIIVIYFLLKMISGGDSESSYEPKNLHYRAEHQEKDMIIENIGVRGKKIYAGTNWFNEELKGRVDDNGIIYRGTSWLNEERIGRIDDEGSIYRGTNSLNEVKVGRIDEKGIVHKGTTWLTEETAGRIDENGNVLKGSSWLNEERKGRIGE